MRQSKILVVEDNVQIGKKVKELLRNFGYTSLMSDGKNALKKVEEKSPDLVLMDMSLKDEFSSIETARQIRSRFGIPIVYLVSNSGKNVIEKAKISDPYGYIIKPVESKNLHISVELALYKHELDRKKREHLLENEEYYQQLVENIDQGIITQDSNGIVTYSNNKFLEMIGYSEHEVLGRTFTDFLSIGILKKKEGIKSSPEKENGETHEIAWRRKDGRDIYTLLSLKPFYDKDKRLKGSVAVLTDITDRRNVEIELKRSREELRSLHRHIHTVKEKESKRIAREIHDELGQQLTALKMDLSWLSSKISSENTSNEILLQKMRIMSGLIDSTIQTVQKISAELRPGLLDDLGLFPAIEWLAQDFQQRTNIPCVPKIGIKDMDLGSEISTAIFRILQEALTNAARHSKAGRVNISLKRKADILEFKIHDNGRGIKKSEIIAPTSLGLIGIRERLRPFGGELEISGKSGSGTTMRIVLPLKEIFKHD